MIIRPIVDSIVKLNVGIVPSPTVTPTPSVTATVTPTISASPTASVTPTVSMSVTPAVTPTPTPTTSTRLPELDLSGIPTKGTVGVSYNGNLITLGGNGTYVYSIWLNSLPPGLSIVGNTVVGIPTTIGSYEIGIQVDSAGMSDMDIITITIS